MATYLNALICNANIQAVPQARTFEEALNAMMQMNADGVTYTVRHEFLVNNIGVLEVVQGRPSFTVPVSNLVDLCTGFVSNVPIEVSVGNEMVPPVEVVVVINSQYTEKKVRLFVNPQQPNYNNHVTLVYQGTLLSPDLRQRITAVPRLISGTLEYSNGVVRRFG